jgi:hypothetical protein
LAHCSLLLTPTQTALHLHPLSPRARPNASAALPSLSTSTHPSTPQHLNTPYRLIHHCSRPPLRLHRTSHVARRNTHLLIVRPSQNRNRRHRRLTGFATVVPAATNDRKPALTPSSGSCVEKRTSLSASVVRSAVTRCETACSPETPTRLRRRASDAAITYTTISSHPKTFTIRFLCFPTPAKLAFRTRRSQPQLGTRQGDERPKDRPTRRPSRGIWKSMSIRKSSRPLLRLNTTSPAVASSSALSQDYSDAKVDAQISAEDTYDEMTDFVPSRPLSVAIPRTPFGSAGPYCPRRPNLSDILNNKSPPPWTLAAFMAYLSQNHCLETLEFTMDASRYRKHYNKMATRSPAGQIVPGSEECVYVQSLWQKLLEAYIVPNGPREVNIPSEVRDSLIKQSNADVPPLPATLDTAVQKVYDLMEESVLVPFLNSFYPQTANPDSAENTSNEDLPHSAHPSQSYDDRSMYRQSRRLRRSSPPFSQSIPASAPPIQNRQSAPSTFSQFARTLSHSARHISSPSSGSHSARPPSSAVLSPWSSNQSESTGNSPVPDLSAGGLTDDTSASSPSAMGEPMTPPTTPPQCDYPSIPHSYSPLSMSVQASGLATRKTENGAWKKVRSSFGFRKKSGGLREEEIDHSTGNLI